MQLINDEQGQASAELILLFGGMIVIVIVAALYYRNYLIGVGDVIIRNDVEAVKNDISSLKNKF